MLFVTHDLSVVRHVSDRIAIMYLGEIVELGETDEVFKRPRHPYTEALFAAIPKPDPRQPKGRIIVEGDIPDAAHRPPGCPFHPRRRYATERCATEKPKLEHRDGAHPVACHFPLPYSEPASRQVRHPDDPPYPSAAGRAGPAPRRRTCSGSTRQRSGTAPATAPAAAPPP